MDKRLVVAVTGASGLVGSRLIQMMPERYEVLKLDRTQSGNWPAQLEGVHAVIHLAGEPIAARRWSAAQKEKIRTSRVEGTRFLVNTLSQCRTKPRVLVSASAIGYYGNRGEEWLDERSEAGRGFLPEVCAQWEGEALKAEALGIRVALLRTGIVLSKNGGALAKMLPPFRFFMGGPLGSGKQFMSWIHLDDEVAAILFCLQTEGVRGAVNGTAPEPVTMRDFAGILGRQMGRPALFPVPASMLRLLLGEMADDLLLSSQRVRPDTLIKSGFRFRHPALGPALSNLLTNGSG